MRNQRKKIWIDRFQTYLSLRMSVYFILYQAAVWSLVAIERRMVDLEETLGGVGVAYSSVITPVAVVVLAALFIYDAVVLAHRIVGPLYRFRKTIQAITAGGEVQPVVLRKNDYLTEMAG